MERAEAEVARALEAKSEVARARDSAAQRADAAEASAAQTAAALDATRAEESGREQSNPPPGASLVHRMAAAHVLTSAGSTPVSAAECDAR